MKKQWIIGGLALVVVLGVCVAPTAAARRPRRTKVVPVSKIVQGQEQTVNDRLIPCPDGSMTLKRELQVQGNVAPWACDEGCSRESLVGTLHMKVQVTRREGLDISSRGCWTAEWELRNGNAVVAEGTGTGIVHGGSHDGLVDPNTGMPQDCERCDIQHHFEGTLTGKSRAPNCKGNLCLSLQGFGFEGAPEGPRNFALRLEGALLTPCD